VTLSVEGQAQPHVLSLGANPRTKRTRKNIRETFLTRRRGLAAQEHRVIARHKAKRPADKKLAAFNADSVDRITIEPARQGETRLCPRWSKGWVRKADKDSPVNAALLTKLLDDLGACTGGYLRG
jgi:hypothetical protein